MNPNQSFETQRKLVDAAVRSIVSGRGLTRRIVPAVWALQRGGRAWHKGLAASGFSSANSEVTWISISNWELTRFGADAKITLRVQSRIERALQGFAESAPAPARPPLFNFRNLGAAIRVPAAQALKLAPPVFRCARMASEYLRHLRRGCHTHFVHLRRRPRN